MHNITCRLLGLLDQIVESYPVGQSPQPVVRDMFGCVVHQARPSQSISFNAAIADTIQVTNVVNPHLTITTPSSLLDQLSISSTLSLAFCVFKDESLFVRRSSYLIDQNRASFQLGSSVVSARLSGGVSVKDLEDPVDMTFTRKQVHI